MSVCGKCRRRKRSVSKGAPVPHNPLPGVSKGASCRRLTAVGEGHGDKEFVRRIDLHVERVAREEHLELLSLKQIIKCYLGLDIVRVSVPL